MPKNPVTSPHRPWSKFEADVKQSLEAIGYIVERDILIAGSQVDLFAHRQRDLIQDRIIVECKSNRHSIGVGQIRNFSSLVHAVSTTDTPCTGLFVSSVGFTKTARAFARKCGILTHTLADLASLSFDPSGVISRTISWFEEDDLASGYVSLSCQVHEFGSGTVYKPVEKFLDDFFPKTTKPGIAVLGNFGTGKTSLCRHYAYLLAQRWLDTSTRTFLPIYINLRDVRSLLRLEQTCKVVLEEEYMLTLTSDGLELWLKHKPTLILLDGFDEMAASLDRISIDQNVRALAQFSERYSCKILLTCRTHFFRTLLDENSLAHFLRLYMRDWGEDELSEYVRKRQPNNSEKTLHTIHTTYNLEELAKTPIFLSMITNTMGELGDSINQAKLYQIYTDRWIEAQDYRSQIAPEDKREFMEILAYELFVSGNSRLSHRDLPDKIRHQFGIRDYADTKKLEGDIRTCSFLVRNEEGEFYFVHRSYMEYFVASRLARKLKEGKLIELSKAQLPVEILGFISNYFNSDWNFLVRLLLGDKNVVVRSNCAGILGRVPRIQRIDDALLLALSTEREDTVRRNIVRAILIKPTDAALREVLAQARLRTSFSIYCVEELGPYIDHTGVKELYSEILQSNDILKVRLVLRNVILFSATCLREDFSAFLEKDWWLGDTETETIVIHAIGAIGDVSIALNAKRLIMGTSLSIDLQRISRAVRDNMSQQARPDIQKMARDLHKDKLTYRQVERQVRRRFDFLVNDDHLRESLRIIFGLREARIAESLPKAVSGGSQSSRRADKD